MGRLEMGLIENWENTTQKSNQSSVCVYVWWQLELFSSLHG